MSLATASRLTKRQSNMGIERLIKARLAILYGSKC